MENQQAQKHQQLLALCEGAICVALAFCLNFIRLKLWFQGGSVDLVMIPLVIYAYRRGMGWGAMAGMAFGLLNCIFDGGIAWGWQSILLDYVVAYAMMGFAGCLRGKKWGLPAGTLVACFARFVIHFISGITIYKILVPTEVLGMTFSNPWLYSLVYNGTYMLPNTILAVALCLALTKPIASIPLGMGGKK